MRSLFFQCDYISESVLIVDSYSAESRLHMSESIIDMSDILRLHFMIRPGSDIADDDFVGRSRSGFRLFGRRFVG